MDELREKEEMVKLLLEEKGLDALLLSRVSNFAWYTGGKSNYVNVAAEFGAASLLITAKDKYLVTDNIEAHRLEREEELIEQGSQFVVTPWHESQKSLTQLTKGLKLGVDGPYPGALDLTSEVARLRHRLTPAEIERFRRLGRWSGEAIQVAARRIRPGMSEHQIAALLAQEAISRGVLPIVSLVATDQRIFDFRHPLPTDKKLERYAMLVLCGRKWGLVASVTRLIHFGPLPDEMRRKEKAVAQVDGTFIAYTRPGARISNIFKKAVETYREVGYPDEWKLHHQGGLAGYEPREYIATPTSPHVVRPLQAFAWNPSITGTKSEDTIIVNEKGYEIITAMGDWPQIPVQVEGQLIERPAILELS